MLFLSNSQHLGSNIRTFQPAAARDHGERLDNRTCGHRIQLLHNELLVLFEGDFKAFWAIQSFDTIFL